MSNNSNEVVIKESKESKESKEVLIQLDYNLEEELSRCKKEYENAYSFMHNSDGSMKEIVDMRVKK